MAVNPYRPVSKFKLQKSWIIFSQIKTNKTHKISKEVPYHFKLEITNCE